MFLSQYIGKTYFFNISFIQTYRASHIILKAEMRGDRAWWKNVEKSLFY